jgi:hypothetical protein
VAGSHFGLIGSFTLDGPTESQPLYVSQISVAGATRDVLFTATKNNTVSAWDANLPGSSALWSTNYGALWANCANTYGYGCGVQHTPAIDVTNGWLFCVTWNNTPTPTLRKINIYTGATIASTDISGTFNSFAFVPNNHGTHVAVLIQSGKVYIAFGAGYGSNGESGEYQGWVMSYDETTMTQSAIFASAPGGSSGNGAGFWSIGGTGDGSSVYLPTGNGEAWNGTTKFRQSVVKLSSALVLQDYFTPSNQAATSDADADLASGRFIIPTGSTHGLIASKDGFFYNVLLNDMGHLQGGGGTAPQQGTVITVAVPASFTGVFGGLYHGGRFYWPTNNNFMKSFDWDGTNVNTTAVATTATARRQTNLTGTSNSGSDSIVWAVTADGSTHVTTQPGTLRAFNADTLAEIFSASTGNIAMWSPPTVTNGRVYVASESGFVYVFGITDPPSTSTRGNVTLNGGVTVR